MDKKECVCDRAHMPACVCVCACDHPERIGVGVGRGGIRSECGEGEEINSIQGIAYHNKYFVGCVVCGS